MPCGCRSLLRDAHGQDIPYSTLTRVVRDLELRDNERKNVPEPMILSLGQRPSTTPPHPLELGGKKIKAQCASLVLAYSKKLFIQYYPNFTRFEAKVFLREAFLFMDGHLPSVHH